MSTQHHYKKWLTLILLSLIGDMTKIIVALIHRG